MHRMFGLSRLRERDIHVWHCVQSHCFAFSWELRRFCPECQRLRKPSRIHRRGDCAASVTVLNLETGVLHSAPRTRRACTCSPRSSRQLPAQRERAGFRKAVLDSGCSKSDRRWWLQWVWSLGQSSEPWRFRRKPSDQCHQRTIGTVVTASNCGSAAYRRSAYNLLTTQPGLIGGPGWPNFFLNGTRGIHYYTTDGINSQNNLLTGYLLPLQQRRERGPRRRGTRGHFFPPTRIRARSRPSCRSSPAQAPTPFTAARTRSIANTAFNANTFFQQRARGPIRSPASRSAQKYSDPEQLRSPVRRTSEEEQDVFNGIWKPYKQRQKLNFTATVYTPTARAGIFRFFPGALNANASASTPTVDFSGNPLQPAAPPVPCKA